MLSTCAWHCGGSADASESACFFLAFPYTGTAVSFLSRWKLVLAAAGLMVAGAEQSVKSKWPWG